MELKLCRCVLNLVINGWPSIQNVEFDKIDEAIVLNLVINGWPSILYKLDKGTIPEISAF